MRNCKKEENKYKLTVDWCNGVSGYPEEGVYWYKEGEEVEFGYGLLKDYINLRVKLDGRLVDPQGAVTMNKDHYIYVCADKEGCPSAEITSFTASKTTVEPGKEVTLTWTTKNGKKATLNGEEVSLNGSKTVTVNQTTEFTLKVSNDCPSEDSQSLTVSVESCKLCDSVFFHIDGSSTLVRNNFPEGQDISFDFQIYNHSETCSFDVPVKWQIKYQESSDIITSGERSIGVVPARTVWDMRFEYDWETKTVTITKLGSSPFSATGDFDILCRKVQVKLAIGNCGGL
jgi:hypothetical protein